MRLIEFDRSNVLAFPAIRLVVGAGAVSLALVRAVYRRAVFVRERTSPHAAFFYEAGRRVRTSIAACPDMYLAGIYLIGIPRSTPSDNLFALYPVQGYIGVHG